MKPFLYGGFRVLSEYSVDPPPRILFVFLVGQAEKYLTFSRFLLILMQIKFNIKKLYT